MTQARTGSLLEGDVYNALQRMAIPSALGMIAMILVNIIDTFWVARLGTEALAAMTFTFPVVGMVINFGLGIMIGTSTAVARALGKGDPTTAAKTTTHACVLGLVFVLVIVIVGLNFQNYLYRWMGAKEELLPLICEYMDIWFLGMVFLILPLIVNGAIRATGDAKTPMYVMMSAAVINGILDPIFIFGVDPWVPAMGLEGAAIATLVARVLGMVYVIYNLVTRTELLVLQLPSVNDFLASCRSIFVVGIPAALTNVLGPISVAVVTAIAAQQGNDGLGAYGIGARLDALVLIVPLSFAGALSPFIGQNWGALLRKRVSAALSICLKVTIGWGIGCAALIFLLAPWLAQSFSDDPQLHPSLTLYLRIVPWGYTFIGFVSIASASFNAVDHAFRSTLLSALRSLVLAGPAAYLGGQIFGLAGVFVGLVVSAALAAALGYVWLSFLLFPVGKRHKESLSAEAATLVLNENVRSPAIHSLWGHLAHLEDLTLQKLDGSRVGFFVGQRQLGHIHDHGRIDVALPEEIGNNLIRFGLLKPHSLDENRGWYSLLPDSNKFSESALWLVRLTHLLYEMSERGENDVVTQKEIQDFVMTDQCLMAIRASTERWRLRFESA